MRYLLSPLMLVRHHIKSHLTESGIRWSDWLYLSDGIIFLFFLQALKKDVLQTKERELFTYFHVQPERLKQTVENLEKRLQAHSVR